MAELTGDKAADDVQAALILGWAGGAQTTVTMPRM